jgi:hypothetical protein
MTRNFPPGDIRVSDADRDAAITELSEHFQAGRLTHEEFEERSGLALRARTGNDLNELFTDLPSTAAAAAAQPPRAAQPPGAPPPDPSLASMPPRAIGRRRYSPARAALAVLIAGLIISRLALGFHHGSLSWLVPVIVVLVIARIILRARRR